MPDSKPGWDEDSALLLENLKSAFRSARDAARARTPPSAALARGWHRTMLAGLSEPDDAAVGRFRGAPGLERCEVAVGGVLATPPQRVAAELDRYDQILQQTAAAVDRMIAPRTLPANADQLQGVIEFAAFAHADWVRIHPFANGNGRTARLWAGFIAMRYGVPPFVRLRPRPGDGYAGACARAMAGDWLPTAEVFRLMYLEAVRR